MQQEITSPAVEGSAVEEPCVGNIIVADAPGLYREALVEVLREAGHDVQSAFEPDEVLQQLLKHPRDLLILALGLPSYDPFELLREVRRGWPTERLAVLATSASIVSETDIPRLLALGCEGFVSKLAPPEHVQFRVRALVHPRQHNARQRPRGVISLPVEWTRGEQRTFHHTFTVSAGGLFIRSESPPGAGEVVLLAFALPGEDDVIRVRAEVIHSRDKALGAWSPAGFGVRFIDLPTEVEERIDGFVRASIQAGL